MKCQGGKRVILRQHFNIFVTEFFIRNALLSLVFYAVKRIL